MSPVAEQAFQRLVEDTHYELRCYLAGFGLKATDIDDVAQETYLSYHARPDARPQGVLVMAWLKGIARNLAYAHLQKLGRHAKRRLDLVIALDQVAPRMAEEVFDEPVRERLRDCLGRLTPDQRHLIALHYAENQDSPSIAQCLGMTVEAVRVRLMRLRHKLRECILHGMRVQP